MPRCSTASATLPGTQANITRHTRGGGKAVGRRLKGCRWMLESASEMQVGHQTPNDQPSRLSLSSRFGLTAHACTLARFVKGSRSPWTISRPTLDPFTDRKFRECAAGVAVRSLSLVLVHRGAHSAFLSAKDEPHCQSSIGTRTYETTHHTN